jgi:hypothetical protein
MVLPVGPTAAYTDHLTRPGNPRLNHRWATYTRRHKRHTVANTAIACLLAGWCWSLAVLE